MDTSPKQNIFQSLGIPSRPVILAPLAGVSDHPFRRTCSNNGADLTYVEMISATALIYKNERTWRMMKRHGSESLLGIQLTGRNVQETAEAVRICDDQPYDTIDINMGCPVTKVVKSGCGSAILKDPKRVFDTVDLCRKATRKPFSVKIRIGWDRNSLNAVEVARAAADAGADWITVHGRTRSDDYSVPVSLEMIAAVKQAVSIPVIGNGNIFGSKDVHYMKERACTDGVMLSRGALGDPWIFNRIKGRLAPLSIEEWFNHVKQHLDWQKEEYGGQGQGAVCMRKHLLWYTKGWPHARVWREKLSQAIDLDAASELLAAMTEQLQSLGIQFRDEISEHHEEEKKFSWDPKWDMNRELDRGVGAIM